MAGADVLLLDRNRAHVEAIKQNGLIIHLVDQITGRTSNEKIFLKAEWDTEKANPCDLVIILTQTFSTHEAIASSPKLFGPDTFVLTLQDGLNNEDVLLDFFPPERVGCGYVTLVSNMVQPGVLSVKIKDEICVHFRCIEGTVNYKLKEIETLFQQTPIKAEYTNDTMRMIWTKAIMTVATSFTSALTGLSPAHMNCMPEGQRLFSRLIREAVAVANECNLFFDADEQVEVFLTETANNLTGFSYDGRALLNRKPTQIEAINGAVGRIGRRYGIDTPANDAVADLVRIIEKTYEISGKEKGEKKDE